MRIVNVIVLTTVGNIIDKVMYAAIIVNIHNVIKIAVNQFFM